MTPASRVSRYARDAKLIAPDEVEKTAALTVRGHQLTGPTLFVVGP